MVDLTELITGTGRKSPVGRYDPRGSDGAERDRLKVVVWNATRMCNLRCRHCYAGVGDGIDHEELSTAEGKNLIDGIAAAGAKVLLFSGGEPLMRKDIFDLMEHAAGRRLHTVLSTNGTLVTPDKASRIASSGAVYAGVSIDGPEPLHDWFRRSEGAYAAAMEGIANCNAAAIRTGLRVTLNKYNIDRVEEMMQIAIRAGVGRLCFYHYVPAGNAGIGDMPDTASVRRAVGDIIDGVPMMREHGIEVLTVDNYSDGPFLYLMVMRRSPEKAAEIMKKLYNSGGSGSGRRIVCVSWDGSVSPDQFMRSDIAGNVRQMPFSDIVAQMAASKSYIYEQNQFTGQCSTCRFWRVCEGNLRARAAACGDKHAADPGCYLIEEETAGTIII